MFSYHDATVAANNCVYRMHNLPFRVELVCNRSTGWQLQAKDDGQHPEEIIASEYGEKPFSIYAVEVLNNEYQYRDKVCFCESRFCKPTTLNDEQSQKLLSLGKTGRIRVGRHNAEYKIVDSGEHTTMHITSGVRAILTDLEKYIRLTGTIFYATLSWDAICRHEDGNKLSVIICKPKNDGAGTETLDAYLDMELIGEA